MAIFPVAPDQTIAQMWSNGVRGGPLSTLTQVGLSHAPTVEAGTSGTVACPESVQKGPQSTR